ncbi:hypothetical protein KFU94_48540 [Chloroflexi bacterium TSY]|nr:hypothetical protein [Chloroflexi bacterium TSY]
MAKFTNGRALIIGVGADLPVTVQDADAVASLLRDPTRCAYPTGQVKLLTEKQACRQYILEELEQLAIATRLNQKNK